MASARFGDERLSADFWKRVRIDGERGCWIWTGSVSSGGGVWMSEGTRKRVHHLTYSVFIAQVDGPRRLLQTCGVKLCCNPDHVKCKRRELGPPDEECSKIDFFALARQEVRRHGYKFRLDDERDAIAAVVVDGWIAARQPTERENLGAYVRGAMRHSLISYVDRCRQQDAIYGKSLDDHSMVDDEDAREELIDPTFEETYDRVIDRVYLRELIHAAELDQDELVWVESVLTDHLQRDMAKWLGCSTTTAWVIKERAAEKMRQAAREWAAIERDWRRAWDEWQYGIFANPPSNDQIEVIKLMSTSCD